MPKFNKPLIILTEVPDKWIYFIKEAENLDVIPATVDDEGLKEAYKDANKHSWTKEELDAYDYAAMREQDERGKVQLAEQRAESKGKIEMAQQLKALGVANEIIRQSSGWSEEEIQNL